jgi:hypothetical protein
MVTLANIWSHESDYTRAERYTRLALAVDPGYTAAPNNLGPVCILGGRAEEGINPFRRSIARDSGSLQCARSARRGIGHRGPVRAIH